MQIVATFSGTSNAAAASGNGSITIARRPSTLRWSQPAPIAQGTALSAAQLNATADVPGSFRYTPPAGTVLPAGPGQKLTAVFVPADQGNYTSEPASVTIDVTPAPTPGPAAYRPASLTLSTAGVVRDTANRRTVVTLRISNTGNSGSGPVRIIWAIAANSRVLNMPQSIASIDGLQSRTIDLHLPLDVRKGATTAVLGIYSGNSIGVRSAPVTIP